MAGLRACDEDACLHLAPPPHPRPWEDDHLETIGGSTGVPGLLIALRSGWVCRPVWRRSPPTAVFPSFLPSFLPSDSAVP